MFDDGLPTGPRYALGLLDMDDNEPTLSRQFPKLEDRAVEVRSLGGWPYYRSERKSLSFNRMSVVESKPERDNGQYVSYDDLLRDHEERKRVEHGKPAPAIQYLNNPETADIPEHIKIENLVDIPEEELNAVIARSKSLSDEIAAIILNEGAAPILSFDSASSYAEAALNDGLNVNGKIDSTIPAALAQILKLSVICKYIENTSIPDNYKRLYLTTLTKLLATTSHDKMIAQESSDRKSALIRAAAVYGRVKRSSQEQVPEKSSSVIGVGQSGSGRRIRQRSSDTDNAR